MYLHRLCCWTERARRRGSTRPCGPCLVSASILPPTAAAPTAPPPTGTRAPSSPHSHQRSSFVFFLMTVVLICARGFLTLVLIRISLMISDVEHLFTCLMAFFLMCVLSLEKCLLSSSAHFSIALFWQMYFLNVLNYESMVTHLQETWKMQNKAIHNSTVY